jgi:hypothetical protein
MTAVPPGGLLRSAPHSLALATMLTPEATS